VDRAGNEMFYWLVRFLGMPEGSPFRVFYLQTRVHRCYALPLQRKRPVVQNTKVLRTGLNNSTFCVCAPLEDSTVTGETNQ
jgi:hypothetical protein